MTETIYQRPPKKDEIKEFLKKNQVCTFLFIDYSNNSCLIYWSFLFIAIQVNSGLG